MNSVRGVVLAAGKSTRFGNYFNKLLTPLCGTPLITHTTQLLQLLNIPTTVVIGHLKEQVAAAITAHNPNATFAIQEEALGTGHALLCSTAYWDTEHILVLNGDMPLVTADLIETLIAEHTKHESAVSFVMAYPDTLNHAYGRVIIDDAGTHIVEAKDFKGDATKEYPINAGIYIFKRSFLEQYAEDLKPNNAQKQLYITDLIGIASAQKLCVNTVLYDYTTIRGVNTLAEFTRAADIMRDRIAQHWLASGVLVEDPTTIWIDAMVKIGAGTRIASGVHLRGATTIGTQSIIEPYSIIENCTIHDMVTVQSHSVIKNSTIHAHASVGPFAHIHHETVIGTQSVVGNFVEVKNTIIGTNTKAKHLSYLGDAQIGNAVNIGAGTITCNYNGTTKARTIIEDESFIGSNSVLIAPITIGEGAYTAAGSTITHSVPEHALAIGRARQVNKPEYAKRLRPVKKITIPSSSSSSVCQL